MPQISLTVEVPWPKGELTFSKLERAVHRAAMDAGRKALVQALGAWEEQLLPTAGARQRRVRRYLLTRVGPVRYWRWKTRAAGRPSCRCCSGRPVPPAGIEPAHAV